MLFSPQDTRKPRASRAFIVLDVVQNQGRASGLLVCCLLDEFLQYHLIIAIEVGTIVASIFLMADSDTIHAMEEKLPSVATLEIQSVMAPNVTVMIHDLR